MEEIGESLQYAPETKGVQILHESIMLIKVVANTKDYGYE